MFAQLEENEYELNIYEDKIQWNGEKMESISNFIKLNRKLTSNEEFINEEIKYISFKYLPFNLKKHSKIETMDYSKLKETSEYENFSVSDVDNYKLLKENEVNIVKNKNFSFYHLEGAHVPYDIDENLNTIENGTYKQKIKASIIIVNLLM